MGGGVGVLAWEGGWGGGWGGVRVCVEGCGGRRGVVDWEAVVVGVVWRGWLPAKR